MNERVSEWVFERLKPSAAFNWQMYDWERVRPTDASMSEREFIFILDFFFLGWLLLLLLLLVSLIADFSFAFCDFSYFVYCRLRCHRFLMCFFVSSDIKMILGKSARDKSQALTSLYNIWL